MAWHDPHKQIRDLLASLYTNRADARRIAKDAHLPETLIDFSGSANNFWTSIVEVAENDQMLIPLIQLARYEYPHHRELAALEKQLIQHDAQRKSQLNIPRLLLYMADRDEHEMELQTSIQHFYADRSRPLLYLIHGDEYQSHDMFLERMQIDILPRLLTTGSQDIIVKNYLLHWPNRYRNPAQLKSWLLMKLVAEIDPSCKQEATALNQALARHPGPVMIRLNVLTGDWDHGSPLTPFLEFWNRWPPLVSPYPLILCFSIKYQSTVHLSWYKRWQPQRLNKQIEQELSELDNATYSNLHIHPLPLLENINRSDAEDWARRSELRRWCPLDKLLNEVGELFAGRDAIPMNFLADELEKILLRNVL